MRHSPRSSRHSRQPSDVGSPISIPVGPSAVSGQWVEDDPAVTIEFDKAVFVGGDQAPGLKCRDANGVPFRASAGIIQINATRIKVPMEYDDQADNQQPILTVRSTGLGRVLKNLDGDPVRDVSVSALLLVPATLAPKVVATFFQDDDSPKVVLYFNTACTSAATAGEVTVFSNALGATIENNSVGIMALGGGARLTFDSFILSGGPPAGDGLVVINAPIVTSIDTALQNVAGSFSWAPLVEESPFGPELIAAQFDPDTFQLQLTFSEDLALVGNSVAGKVNLVDGSDTTWTAETFIDVVDEVATIQMAFNPFGAGTTGTSSSGGIGTVLASSVGNVPARDFTAAPTSEGTPTIGPRLLDATYSLATQDVSLRFSEALVVAANPATATVVHIRRPGDVDQRHNLTGVALLTLGTKITNIPVDTVDNSIVVAEACTTSDLAPGDIVGAASAVDAVAWADFPMRIVA
jgi:hypothetical protein